MGDPASGCIFYTEEQTDILLRKISHDDTDQNPTKRIKRKLDNFEKEPYKLWDNPIIYIFDGSHSMVDNQLFCSISCLIKYRSKLANFRRLI